VLVLIIKKTGKLQSLLSLREEAVKARKEKERQEMQKGTRSGEKKREKNNRQECKRTQERQKQTREGISGKHKVIETCPYVLSMDLAGGSHMCRIEASYEDEMG
jgi:hypothetical protein